MTDHPRFRVVCHCDARSCPYRSHRKVKPMKKTFKTPPGLWSGLLTAAVVWAWIGLFVTGVTPSWLYWIVFGLIVAVLGWLYFVPASWRVSWRVNDSRTTEGDERGRPGWAKDDDTRL